MTAHGVLVVGLDAEERQLLLVGAGVVLPQPEKMIECVDCRLHQVLHLFIVDVRYLGAAVAIRAQLVGFGRATQQRPQFGC